MEKKRQQLFDVCVRELKPSIYFLSQEEYAWHFVNVVFHSEIDEDTEYYEIASRYTKSGRPVVVEFKNDSQ